MSKILSPEDLLIRSSAWRAAGQKIGFTCGAFDLLHAGHVDYLEQARALCDRLIVAVNTDDSVRSYKNPFRPIIGEEHRAKVISALACVDGVTLMPETRPTKLLELLKPDIYIKGGDYTVSQLRSAPLVESYGGRCEVIPVTHEISSSAIIKHIESVALHADPERIELKLGAPIVFLDRDGTLIHNVHFLNDPTRVKLLDGVGAGLRELQDNGFTLLVVTNQQGIGLGYFNYSEFVAVNSEMLRQLSPFGVRISRFYFCPHSVSEQCSCRKPGTKLLERGLHDFKAHAAGCYLIGDTESDIAAAERAGCKGLLVADSGAGKSFAEAVKQILVNHSSFAKTT